MSLSDAEGSNPFSKPMQKRKTSKIWYDQLDYFMSKRVWNAHYFQGTKDIFQFLDTAMTACPCVHFWAWTHIAWFFWAVAHAQLRVLAVRFPVRKKILSCSGVSWPRTQTENGSVIMFAPVWFLVPLEVLLWLMSFCSWHCGDRKLQINSLTWKLDGCHRRHRPKNTSDSLEGGIVTWPTFACFRRGRDVWCVCTCTVRLTKQADSFHQQVQTLSQLAQLSIHYVVPCLCEVHAKASE